MPDAWQKIDDQYHDAPDRQYLHIEPIAGGCAGGLRGTRHDPRLPQQDLTSQQCRMHRECY